MQTNYLTSAQWTLPKFSGRHYIRKLGSENRGIVMGSGDLDFEASLNLSPISRH